ncbi:MAG: N-acetylglucosamine-6-phosphate deacetylase, partial [Pseudomonadota bacterium]
MNRTRIAGNILTPHGWVDGEIEFDQRIVRIDGSVAGAPGKDGPFILPGFIDLHVHGGGGRDIMEGGDAPHAVARQA